MSPSGRAHRETGAGRGRARTVAARVATPRAHPASTPVSGIERSPGGGVDVQVVDVFKSFGPIDALRGVSLSVKASAFVTITGPSGSGKSTLLNVIGSLDRPDSGTVTVGGAPVPLPAQAVSFRRYVVGFVFQENLLLPYLSVQHNIEAALVATGRSRRERRRRSTELLEEVGLADRARDLPSQLSGGQRQTVALARALANEPRLLLADEPTGALDSAAGERAMDMLEDLRRRHGMTVIVVSHDVTVAHRSDHVITVVDGRVQDA